MGVVNVTDDSFSDGGRYLDADRAVEQGLALATDGATIIDVGGESTRPGAQRIDPRVETARIVPVVKELAAKGITVSIDTMHAGVARAALENGASMVNDVSGGRADEDMAGLLVEADVPWVLMHWRSVSAQRPHQVPAYRDVVAEVRAELMVCVDNAVAAGVNPAKLIIDPGWVSPSPRKITGRCCRRCRSWWPAGCRCWWAPHVSVFSADCWPVPMARFGHRTAARRPRRWCRHWPRCTGRGEFGYTTCGHRSMLSKW